MKVRQVTFVGTVSACPADVCRYGVTMSDAVLAQRAEALLALHQPGNPVVLPTVWDAWSATLAVSAGFAALTVGSHPVADSVGKPDGEGMSFDDLTTRVSQITAAVDVPVSVDIESGYGEAPSRLISGLLAAGAVGLNIEDTVHKDGGRIRDAQEHADLVGELRRAADASGVHVVINARTGSIVVNQAVTLAPCAVAHGNLSVTISNTPVVSQPNALASGTTVARDKADITISQQAGSLIQMPAGTQLVDVVKALNSLGATPQDLLAILQAIKAAGALNAELEVI